jgi:hypothetical protein
MLLNRRERKPVRVSLFVFGFVVVVEKLLIREISIVKVSLLKQINRRLTFSLLEDKSIKLRNFGAMILSYPQTSNDKILKFSLQKSF